MMHPKDYSRKNKVDKSKLTHGEPFRIRDREYLDSFKGRACECCGIKNETIVPAHFSLGNYAFGAKAGDDLVVALCMVCHDLADKGRNREQAWLDILKGVLHGRYVAWLAEKQMSPNERVDG